MYSSALETDVGCMGLGLIPPSHPLAIDLMDVSRFAYSFIHLLRSRGTPTVGNNLLAAVCRRFSR